LSRGFRGEACYFSCSSINHLFRTQSLSLPAAFFFISIFHFALSRLAVRSSCNPKPLVSSSSSSQLAGRSTKKMEQRAHMEDRLKQLELASDERKYISLLQQSNRVPSDSFQEDEPGEGESSCNVSPASSNKSFKEYATSSANFDRSTPRLFHSMLSNNLSRRNSTSKICNLVQDFSCMSVMDSPSEEYVSNQIERPQP